MHYRQRLGIAAIWTTAYLVLAGGLLGSLSAPASAEISHTFSFCFTGGPTVAPCQAGGDPLGAFVTLEGIAIDNSSLVGDASKGDLYVSDNGSGRRIVERFSSAGVFECELNANGAKPCAANSTGFAANTTSGSKVLAGVSSFAGSVAVGSVISGAGIASGATVASVNTGAGTLELSAAATVTATGVALTATIALDEPLGDAVGPNGEIYVVEGDHNVVDRFSAAGTYESQIVANTNKTSFTANTTSGSKVLAGVSSFAGSVAVGSVISGAGIASGATVASVNTGAGTLELSAAATVTATGVALTATTEFHFLYGLAVGPDGEVWVDDTGTNHNVIDEFELNGSTWEYKHQLTGAQTPAGITWALTTPGDIAVDAHKYVYVVDKTSGHDVVDVFNASGGYESQFTTPSVPSSVAVNTASGTAAAGTVYVGLGSSVAEYGAASLVGGHWTVGGLVNQFGSGNISTSEGLAVSATNGEVYLADKTKKDIAVFQQVIFPTVKTGSAAGIQATSEKLLGTVNPEEIKASSEFEYGTSTSYSATIATAPAEEGLVNTEVPVEAKLTSLVPNTLYHYRLEASNANGARDGADATFQTPLIAPTVNDQPPNATSIEPSTGTGTVRFCGTINPEHAEGKYHFIYGTTSSYGQETKAVETGTEYGDLEVCQTAEGLLPSTTYHFVLAAEDAAGPVQGPDYTFTTAPALTQASEPGVQTGAASGITQSTATISGTVDPNGLPTTYAFELGPSTAYGTVIYGYAGEGALPSGGAGQLAESVTLALSDLAPGSTYHYRLVAFNGAGASYGVDQTFTTPGVAGVFAQPLTPAFVVTPIFEAVKETVTSTKKTKSKPLTKAQKLTRALKECKKYKAAEKRRKCEQQAHRKYMTKKKAEATATKQTNSRAGRRVK